MPRWLLVPSLALALLLPDMVWAQSMTIDNPCPITFLPCATGGAGGVGSYLKDVVFPGMRIAFIAMALAHFFYYGFRMLYEGNDEEATKTAKQGYEQALYGCAYMSFATFVVEAFGESARTTLINPEPLGEGISNIIVYFKVAVAALVTLVITIVAFRLVIVQDDSEKEKAKKRLLSCFLGVGAMLVADSVVAAFQPGYGSAGLSAEIVGVGNFLLTIFGALAVLWFVGAGIAMVVSPSTDGSEQAKKAMTTALTAIAVVMASYVLLNFFLSL